MKYQSEAIAQVIKHLNVNYFLPAIQREYVWRQDQIIVLFDSLMREYPISTFLFWELEPENYDKWEIYKFINNFDQTNTHNETANTNGVQNLNLVLDGQQRLTSLFIGLKGTYTVKKKYVSKNHSKAWQKQKLYLDLLHYPAVTEDQTEEDIHYSFRFIEPAAVPAWDNKQCWFEVGQILNFTSKKSFEDFLDQAAESLPDDTVTIKQKKIFEKNLRKLYNTIWEQDCIAYYTEHDQDFDRVLTIFVRANQGGTILSKSDLLLSMMTAKWESTNARDEIYDFVEHLNKDLARKNNFDKDFIMKTCLVLSDLPVQYKVENFNAQNLKLIHSKWQCIKKAIEVAANLINMFGIDRDTLTSANALIPIIYYVYKHPGINFSLASGSAPVVQNTKRIRQWFFLMLLNNTFSGQSDRALNDTRKALNEARNDNMFPVRNINAELRRTGRKANFEPETIETILNLTYGKPLTYLVLSLLYGDNTEVNNDLHQDHIFPQDQFKPQHMTSVGLSIEQQKSYKELMNRLGNLQLLPGSENEEKSNQDFSKWLTTRDPVYRKKHLIPDNDLLLTFDQFADFMQAREEIIRQRLAQIFAS
ncbi:hypothetical protein KSC_063310 [Ktedonobacter sp. SOSP1-52]|uniref:DUF262 domain-containing protein n=1 Tax=Ktedonobacter sp. SOSP1-52 TaxID=2778366 RepID=UPI001915922C|nr:DUF262 domain-containing protein [Ktedonobacter sp. SOSP1-52]GHO67439.1 hypothetical protein KSC_063310 [Ktedonobacter sp. SOSP1-52]